MRFVLLGAGDDALDLANVILADSKHRLVAALEVPTDVAEVLSAECDLVAFDSWESLLDESFTDVVIVGETESTDRRAEQLRKLTQASVPMVVVHPGCESIVGYELEMIRSDTDCPLVPYCPGMSHPVLVGLRQLVEAGCDRIDRATGGRRAVSH